MVKRMAVSQDDSRAELQNGRMDLPYIWERECTKCSKKSRLEMFRLEMKKLEMPDQQNEMNLFSKRMWPVIYHAAKDVSTRDHYPTTLACIQISSSASLLNPVASHDMNSTCMKQTNMHSCQVIRNMTGYLFRPWLLYNNAYTLYADFLVLLYK